MEEIRIDLGNIQKTGGQISNGPTCLLVLRGDVMLKHTDHNRSRTMHENDLEVINHNDFYSLEGTGPNVVLSVCLARECLQRLCPAALQCRFDCGTSSDPAMENLRQQLRRRLTLMTMLHFRRGGEDHLLILSELLQVLYTLLHNFRISSEPSGKKLNTRLEPILTMMARRYREPLGLEQTAHEFFLSNSYLARLFRRELGMTFVDYLTLLRLENVRSDLLYTDDPVARIAMESGFSSAQAMSRAFKKNFRIPPSEYRKQIKPEHARAEKSGWSHFDADGSLDMLARFLDRYEQKSIDGTGLCPISMTAAVTPFQLPRRIIDVGDIYQLLRGDVRAQLIQAQREIHFSHVRFSGLFVPRPDLEIFSQLDKHELFDLFTDCGLIPFVQVDSLDDAGSLLLVLDTFREYCKTSGPCRWKFELPGDAKSADWLREAARSIRSVCPDAEVGLRVNPANLPKPVKQGTASSSWCLTADFFTIESDPNQTAVGTVFDERDQRGFHKNIFLHLREWMKTQKISAPIYLTGWNTLTGRSIAEAGEFHRSALIADTVLSLREETDGIAFPLNLHQIEATQPYLPTYPLSLFLYRDIRRPLFFVLRSLCSMGPWKVYEEDGILVTRDGEDSYAMLLWHPCYINPFESLDNMRQDDYKKGVHLTLNGLRPGRYRIKNLYLNRDNGSIYSSWIRVGVMAPMDQDVLDCMRHFSSPLATLDEQIVTDHISVHQTLSLNAVALWRIWRITDAESNKGD